MEELEAPSRTEDAEPAEPGGCVVQNESSTIASLIFNNKRLATLAFAEVAHNINRRYDQFNGGQAQVYLCAWRNLPTAAQPLTIVDGRRVAIKRCRQLKGGGHFEDIASPDALRQAVEDGRKLLDWELDVLQRLHDKGCGERVVCPLAQTRWLGKWFDDPAVRAQRWFQPCFAYLMPEYRLGSVRSLLDDVCNRRAPEAAQRRFLSMSFISGEMATLLGELCKIHDPVHGAGFMIQDLTPGNLLVDDEYSGGGGMRLLLSDPGMAASIRRLKQGTSGSFPPMGTSVWGCMAARNRQFDETADLYSLSAVGSEMWLVAEGALVPTEQALILLGLDDAVHLPQGVQFMRHLVLETVKTHHRGGKLNPRVTRHLPVSWLGAWALLLGCRDHKTEADMWSGRPHLRPSEAEMLGLYQQWARTAAAAEALPLDLTPEHAAGPGCAALVADMCGLFGELKRLSHLEQGGELEDVPTRWFAANFMEQRHPLVAAMRAQGAIGVGKPDAPRPAAQKCRDGWCHAMQRARHAAAPALVDDVPKYIAHQGVSSRKRKGSQAAPQAPAMPAHARLELLQAQGQQQLLLAQRPAVQPSLPPAQQQQQSRSLSAGRPPLSSHQLGQHRASAGMTVTPGSAAAAATGAAAAAAAQGMSSLSLHAAPAMPPGTYGGGCAVPPCLDDDVMLGSPSKRARAAQRQPNLAGARSSAAIAAAVADGGGSSSWAAGQAGGAGAFGTQSAAMPIAAADPVLAGVSFPAASASSVPGSGGTPNQPSPLAGQPGWSAGRSISPGCSTDVLPQGLQQTVAAARAVGTAAGPAAVGAGAAVATAGMPAAWAFGVPAIPGMAAAMGDGPAMLPPLYAGPPLGGSAATLPSVVGPQLQSQPAAQPTAPQPLPQLGGQFAAFAYPSENFVTGRWGKEEQSYAEQIVAAFTAQYPGLRERALYASSQAGEEAGYSAELVGAIQAAKLKLLATFVRCFPARCEPGPSNKHKQIRDKIRQILGHK